MGKLLFNFNSQIRVPYIIQIFYDFSEYSVNSFDIRMFILNYVIRFSPIMTLCSNAIQSRENTNAIRISCKTRFRAFVTFACFF